MNASHKKEKPQALKPTPEELLACLERSGYMMESRIVRQLNEAGFFVEPNQSIMDERTGKSRELDIIAEFYKHRTTGRGICVKTTFVIEAINNRYPLVLTTTRPPSPNSPIDDYFRFASTPSEDDLNPFLAHINIYDIREYEKWVLYSQYCAFTRKKENDELMASHPDDVHSSLLKMVEYSIDAIEGWREYKTDKWWRMFFWQPVLVIRDDLYVLNESDDGQSSLISVSSAKLEYNFHYRGRPQSFIIEIVTADHLHTLLKKYVDYDDMCEEVLEKLKFKT